MTYLIILESEFIKNIKVLGKCFSMTHANQLKSEYQSLYPFENIIITQYLGFIPKHKLIKKEGDNDGRWN
jgi:hypothetical protein